MIKALILSILNMINRIVPKGNTVIFCSFPDLEGNSLALYRYIAKERPDLFDKYNLVWSVKSEPEEIKRRLTEIDGRREHPVVNKLSIKGMLTYFRASKIITTHNYITGLNTVKGQTHYNLWHGMPFKAGNGRMKNLDKKDYIQADVMIAISDFFRTIKAEVDMIPEGRIKVTGQPADDSVLKQRDTLKKLGVDKEKYRKVILWLPTYRKSDVGSIRQDSQMQGFGVSTVLLGECDGIIDALKRNNILLLVKFHPMDVLRNTEFPSHENIRIIKAEEMKKAGVTINELMGDSDTLITDYSSAFITYMLTGRPVVFVVGDIEDYKNTRGFSIDDPDKLMAGEKIKDKDGFVNYLNNIDSINQGWREKYREVQTLMHKYTDGRSSERVCKLIFGKKNMQKTVFADKDIERKRVMVFQPTVPPYRIDFFNGLYDRLGAKIYLYYRNLKSQKFDYDKIEKQLHFMPDYFSRSIKVGGREHFLGHMKRIKAYRPDVVISGEYGLGLWCAVLYKKLYNKSCKVISICDDSLDIALKCKGARRISRDLAMKQIDGLILCNKKASAFYRKCFGMDSVVFPIIMSEESFYADKDEAVKLAKKHIDEYDLLGKRFFIFVGRLAPEKNIEYLIRSFVRSHDSNKENVLYIVGDDGGNGYGDKLKRIVRDADAGEYITFLGRKEGTELKSWLYLGQCLVLPSHYDRFGAVVGEALLAGEYVMVSDKAGAAELVSPLNNKAGNGIIFDIDRPYIVFDGVTDVIMPLNKDWKPGENRLNIKFSEYMNKMVRWICLS